MAELFTELLFGMSQFFYLSRTVYQVNVSRKNKRSTTPILYWVLTIMASLSITTYGLFVGSIIIPLSTIPIILSSLYNIHLEQKRNKTKEVRK